MVSRQKRRLGVWSHMFYRPDTTQGTKWRILSYECEHFNVITGRSHEKHWFYICCTADETVGVRWTGKSVTENHSVSDNPINILITHLKFILDFIAPQAQHLAWSGFRFQFANLAEIAAECRERYMMSSLQLILQHLKWFVMFYPLWSVP